MKMVTLDQHQRVMAEVNEVIAGQIKAIRRVGSTMEEVLGYLDHDDIDGAREAVEFTLKWIRGAVCLLRLMCIRRNLSKNSCDFVSLLVTGS